LLGFYKDDNEGAAKPSQTGDQKFDRGKGVISEKWSNSDSREFELEGEEFDNLISYISNTENNQSPFESKNTKSFPHNEEFDKHEDAKQKSRRRKERGNAYKKDKKNKLENDSKTVYKCRTGDKIIIYEAKNKPETVKSDTINKVQAPLTAQTELVSQVLQTPPKNNHGNFPFNSSNEAKPRKGKPLSLKSPSLDTDVVKIAKVKMFTKEFFDKKFEKDIFDHVANLTEESNKVMPYRILAHSRIDYVIKQMFTGRI